MIQITRGAEGGGVGIGHYYFYFGDGGSDDNWWGTAEHTYTTPGDYEAEVWVVDDDWWESLDPGLRQVTVVWQWLPGPGPTGSIRCSNGQEWAHINDEREWIPLEIEDGEDHDDMWVEDHYETQTGNYIDLDSTEWWWDEGEGYCWPWYGPSTCWYATSTAQPTWVKAKLVDYSDSPAASANDGDVWTAQWTNLHGFRVGVKAEYSGAWTGVWETKWEGQSWILGGEDDVVLHTWAQGKCGHSDDFQPTHFLVTLTGVTEPSHAVPAGFVSAFILVGLDVNWAGCLLDCDEDDQNYDQIGVEVTAWPSPVTVSFTKNIVDTQEAVACGDWAYQGDFGDQQRSPTGTPLVKYESGDWDEEELPGGFDVSASLSSCGIRSWKAGQGAGTVIKGEFGVSAWSYCTNHCLEDFALCTCTLHNPTISLSSICYVP